MTENSLNSSERQVITASPVENTNTKNAAAAENVPPVKEGIAPIKKASGLHQWYLPLKESFSVFLATRLGFIVTSMYAVLFTIKDFNTRSFPINILWDSWHHWDTGFYLTIAQHGYRDSSQTAFFPLFPLLIRILTFISHDPMVSALIISNLAGLGALLILYRLVKEDYNRKLARRTILYLSFFPTAFFLASGYNESTFLFVVLLSFYCIRKGNWWLAGSFGLLASLTRAAGLFLVLPFCYDYLLQHDFKLKRIRFDVLACTLIPLGTSLFAGYCYLKFHDPLAFSHAEVHWRRALELPWQAFVWSIQDMSRSNSLLTFLTLRNLLDLTLDLVVLATIILMFVGPWRLPRKYWSYAIIAATWYFFIMIVPTMNITLFPLQSDGRYMLEIFPAFIILAMLGKNRTFHLSYLAVSGALLFFLLTQFLTGHWIV